MERLNLEKEVTGMYLSGHPLGEYADLIPKLGTAKISHVALEEYEDVYKRQLVECVRPQLYIHTPEKQTRIVLATLGNDAGLIGAAFLSRAQ